MPRTPHQFAQIREETREKLLKSALRLFARHGYATTSVRMLADDAGISQGLLYNYFTGKEALLRAIFERSMQEVGESFARTADAPNALEGLETLVRSAMELVRKNEDFWRLSYQLRMQPEVLAGLGGDVRTGSEGIVSRIGRLLHNAGSERPMAEARALFAAIDGAAQHYVLDPDHYPLEEVAEELVRRFRPPGRSESLLKGSQQ
jgi:AcrR family transcriptional regulator